MKIYTQKQITEIENQALNKIYNALSEIHESDTDSDIVKGRHDEFLDIALKHLHSKPTGHVYGWLKKGKLEGNFL